MRRTASGGGAGSFNARRQALMRSGSQRLRSGVSVGLRRGRLEDRETLELVAGARHAFDVQRAPRHQADEAERPRRALCDPGKSHSRLPPASRRVGPNIGTSFAMALHRRHVLCQT